MQQSLRRRRPAAQVVLVLVELLKEADAVLLGILVKEMDASPRLEALLPNSVTLIPTYVLLPSTMAVVEMACLVVYQLVMRLLLRKP